MKQNSKLKFDFSATIGSFWNPSTTKPSVTISCSSTSYYYQPQENLAYTMVFHKDYPYYQTPTSDHACTSSTSTDEKVAVKYFDWNTITDENIATATAIEELSAVHYDFLGWTLGSSYVLNSEDEPLKAFDGKAFNINWTNNNETINIAPMWQGHNVSIKFHKKPPNNIYP